MFTNGPTFRSAPATDRMAAFLGRSDVTKAVATIDHVFSDASGAQNRSLGPWVRSGFASLAQSRAATGSHGTGVADVETEIVDEQWSSTIDDDLLATLAAGRRL
jgi:hypothetical protein